MTVSVLTRFNLRYYRRHVLLSLLCLMGISLGVGIVVAVELINKSALESFTASVDFLSGKATHSVVSDYGMIPEGSFAGIWRNAGVKAATPVVEAMATAVETGKEPIRFLGLDPFLDADFRTFTPEEEDGRQFTAFLTGEPVRLYLSRELMRRCGLKAGDTLTVLTAGVEKKTKIIGALPGSEEISLGDNLAVLDIAGAQELFGKIGYLDRIDIEADGDVDALRKELPPGLSIVDRTGRKSTLRSMLYSFQLNLAAMSLLALFVGIFLIYNFSMFSVLSRREDMSLLLTLGADRKGLVGAFLLESLILGAAGSLAGLGFGYAVAWFSIERVSSTISQLYFQVAMNGVHLTPGIVLIGMGVGFFRDDCGNGSSRAGSGRHSADFGHEAADYRGSGSRIEEPSLLGRHPLYGACGYCSMGGTFLRVLGFCLGICRNIGHGPLHSVNPLTGNAPSGALPDAGSGVAGRIPGSANDPSLPQPHQRGGGCARSGTFHDYRRGQHDPQLQGISSDLAAGLTSGRSLHLTEYPQMGAPSSAGPHERCGS